MNKKSGDFRCSREHVWARKWSDTAIQIGLTDIALEALGEIVALELPGVGELVKMGQPIGTVESAKTVSDLYSPVDGEVTAVNDALDLAPYQLNLEEDPQWLVQIRLQQPEQWDELLTVEQYLECIKGES